MCMCLCVAVCALKNNRHHFGKRTGVRHASSCRDPTSAPARAPASASQMLPKVLHQVLPQVLPKITTSKIRPKKVQKGYSSSTDAYTRNFAMDIVLEDV